MPKLSHIVALVGAVLLFLWWRSSKANAASASRAPSGGYATPDPNVLSAAIERVQATTAARTYTAPPPPAVVAAETTANTGARHF